MLLSPSSDFLPNILQLMGLAVYNSINLDVRFPPCCYKKLLSPAVVPYNNPRAVVGVANMGLKDLEAAMPVSQWKLCKNIASQSDLKCQMFSHEGKMNMNFNSLRPSDAYMRQ